MLGYMAAPARAALFKYATGHGAALSAGLMGRKIDELRAERAGPNPTPLERRLAERVALCWFEVSESDRRVVGQRPAPGSAARGRGG